MCCYTSDYKMGMYNMYDVYVECMRVLASEMHDHVFEASTANKIQIWEHEKKIMRIALAIARVIESVMNVRYVIKDTVNRRSLWILRMLREEHLASFKKRDVQVYVWKCILRIRMHTDYTFSDFLEIALRSNKSFVHQDCKHADNGVCSQAIAEVLEVQ